MEKLLFAVLFSVLNCFGLFGQTKTVTFKPDAPVGCDAVIFTSYGDIIGDEPQSRENLNYGMSGSFGVSAWTMDGKRTTHRSLLKFTGLSTIPKNAKVISAELKLYGLPYGDVNSSSNQSVIEKITSNWDEYTVTWNTQPTTTAVNQINVPESTSEYNWNYTDSSENLVAMVQDMVSNPESNFGFMIRLITEETYRRLSFASSDHGDSALWPELTVTYENCSIEHIIKDKFKVVIVKNPNKIKEKYKIVRIKKIETPANSTKGKK